jgi:hypothetical protein
MTNKIALQKYDGKSDGNKPFWIMIKIKMCLEEIARAYGLD